MGYNSGSNRAINFNRSSTIRVNNKKQESQDWNIYYLTKFLLHNAWLTTLIEATRIWSNNCINSIFFIKCVKLRLENLLREVFFLDFGLLKLVSLQHSMIDF